MINKNPEKFSGTPTPSVEWLHKEQVIEESRKYKVGMKTRTRVFSNFPLLWGAELHSKI